MKRKPSFIVDRLSVLVKADMLSNSSNTSLLSKQVNDLQLLATQAANFRYADASLFRNFCFKKKSLFFISKIKKICNTLMIYCSRI